MTTTKGTVAIVSILSLLGSRIPLTYCLNLGNNNNPVHRVQHVQQQQQKQQKQQKQQQQQEKQQVKQPLASRRHFVSATTTTAAVAAVAALSTSFSVPSPACAKCVGTPLLLDDDDANNKYDTPERRALLHAIANNLPDDVVLNAISSLVPLSPLSTSSSGSSGRGSSGSSSASAVQAALDGQWQLLWYNFDSFSPLLKLPPPFRPTSYQYFGSIAAREVGPARVAQGLTGGILSSNQLWLSSSAINNDEHASVLEIYPPFRFQWGQRAANHDANDVNNNSTNNVKRTIVESSSDADFRKVNARTKEAQLAPKNLYDQVYLEDSGARGSLRISTIVEGDPVIVGNIFVHQKL